MTTGAAAASSGIRRLLSAIDNPADNLEHLVGVRGNPYAFDFDGVPMTLAIEGEAGKINPLTADRAILEDYVGDLLMSAGDKASLLALVDAARTTNDGPAAMEALYGFVSPAIGSEFVERDFTLSSTLMGVDPLLASGRVLRALPDLGDAIVTSILRLRETNPEALSIASAYAANGRPLFTLVASVHWNDSESTTKRVPIEITTAGRASVLSGFR